MKKLLVVIAALAAAMICQPAQVKAEWIGDMAAPVANKVTGDVTDFGGGESIEIKSVQGGDQFEVALYNVKLTPKGVSETLYDAKVVRIASGILDAAMASGNRNVASPYITDAEVTGGKAIFQLANYAKTAVTPIVEHLWGIGTAGDNQIKFLVLNPNSVWVVYENRGGKPDLDTLAIGLVMCPNGKVIPLKNVGQGKLKQGRHPELAYACETKESLSLELETVKR